ncbi:MAG: oxygen-independent coproporphyrinogen III oxidase [Gammaproteobacteria bacterium]
MQNIIEFDEELIRRYDLSGPRYTSYPTAVSFSDAFGEKEYLNTAQHSNEDPIPVPLSLYFHIPFCKAICFYCGCNKIATKNYAMATDYLSLLYREIAMQASIYDHDRVVEQLHWGGGTPTFLNTADMQQLMAETRKHFNLLDDDSGDYSIEIDPRSVSPEKISLLRELGFNRFSLGVQDINEAVQIAVNRVQPIEETVAIVDACRKVGARSINLDLIYGLPFQSMKSFSRTLDVVIELLPDRLSVFNYAHLPEIFKPQRRINEADLPSSDVKLEILNMVINKLTEAGYVYIGMDHFARPDDELVIAQNEGTLHRNFQGYSTHGDCDIVAMGVSSISKVGNVYSQNVKDLESYTRLIIAGHFPVMKGIQLNRDDEIRRELIQWLTCEFMLDIPEFELLTEVVFQDYFADELLALQGMVDDGLVTVSADKIQILPRGRLLVRNICMIFDVSLQRGGKKGRFSKVI